MTPRTHAPTAPATSVRTLWVRLADAATAITPHSMLALVNRVAIAGIFWMSARTKVEGWFTISDSAYALGHIDWIVESQSPDGRQFVDRDSLHVFAAVVEPALAQAAAEARFQFEREGYYCRDSREPGLVFNRTVGLRDTWQRKAGSE